jgi:calcineurin-like phosphoesterase family protein
MSQIKPTFFTSDWHLGHQKVLNLDNRPFNDLKEMHSALVTRYNSTVPHKGICYFLGDMGNKTSDLKPVITQLQGTKVLVLGNHDHGINTMYNCGFDVVTYMACIYIGPHRITMSHCPLKGVWREDCSHIPKSVGENWHGESRAKHQRHTIADEGQFHLHGHIHSHKDKSKSQKILGKQYDIGVTANNYTPVSLSQIESWVMTYGR